MLLFGLCLSFLNCVLLIWKGLLVCLCKCGFCVGSPKFCLFVGLSLASCPPRPG